MSEPVYRIKVGDLAHEVVEGEALLISFATGAYYSLDGVGGVVWDLLGVGPGSATSLAAALGPASGAEPEVVGAALAGLLRQLADEGLVEIVDADPVALAPCAPGSGPFVPPVLQKYTDLEALLLLDPIHDVLSAGWPHSRSGADPAGR
jgi:hypothetical protein